MNRLVYLHTRHTPTAVDSDTGRKLDEPSEEGYQEAYSRGVEYRTLADRDRGDTTLNIRGFHSAATQRTRTCSEAFLLGAGVSELALAKYNLPAEALDPFRQEGDPQYWADLRNGIHEGKPISDGQKLEIMLTDHRELIEKAGEAGAEFSIDVVSNWPGNDYRLTHSWSHSPVVDAATLVLLGRSVTYENVLKFTGPFGTGEGFRFFVREKEDSSRYHVSMVSIPAARNSIVTTFELDRVEAYRGV